MQALLGDVSPALLEGFTKDDQTYLLPNNWNTMLIYYNPKLFEQAGIERPSDDWTWDDFLAVAKQADHRRERRRQGVRIRPADVHLRLHAVDLLERRLHGLRRLDDANLTDPGTVEAIQFIPDLVFDEKVAPNPTGGDPTSLFPAGKVAMTGARPPGWDAREEPAASRTTCCRWPAQDGAPTCSVPPGSRCTPGPKNKDLAWELLKELASQETQTAWAESGGLQPDHR